MTMEVRVTKVTKQVLTARGHGAYIWRVSAAVLGLMMWGEAWMIARRDIANVGYYNNYLIELMSKNIELC